MLAWSRPCTRVGLISAAGRIQGWGVGRLGALAVSLPGARRRLDADDHVADLAARLDVLVGLDDLLQPIPPVDQRPERSGIQHLPEVARHLWVVPGDVQHDLPAAKQRATSARIRFWARGPNSDDR